MWEAKYSSRIISYNYMNGSVKRKKNKYFSVTEKGPLDQVKNTKKFCGFDEAYLVTNNDFDDAIRRESKKYKNIFLVNGDELQKWFNRSRWFGKSIDDAISNTNVPNNWKNVIYLMS